MWNRFVTFITRDIWRYPIDKGRPVRSFFLHWTRILVASVQGFIHHQCFYRAALLTYYTLLAIVPVLAVAFGVAKGFGFENFFEKQLRERFIEHPEIVNKVISFAHNLLDRTQEGLIVLVGVIFLFWTVLRLLGNIENALNTIWEVVKARSIARKITDYFALVIFCPFFFVFSSTGAVFLLSQLGEWAPVGSHVLFSFHFLLLLLLSWILFSFIYVVMPNTKVDLKYGILAGVVGGSIYQLVQWCYVSFQIGVSSYGAIYGSFAALPLFLIWVHLSWIIFLFGAEIGYHAEDESYARFRGLKYGVVRKSVSKAEIGVLISFICVRAFCFGEKAPSLREISNQLQLSVRHTKAIADQLIESGILIATNRTAHDEQFQPAKDVGLITLSSVLDAMNESQKKSIYTANSPELEQIQEIVSEMKQSEKNILLRDIGKKG